MHLKDTGINFSVRSKLGRETCLIWCGKGFGFYMYIPLYTSAKMIGEYPSVFPSFLEGTTLEKRDYKTLHPFLICDLSGQHFLLEKRSPLQARNTCARNAQLLPSAEPYQFTVSLYN